MTVGPVRRSWARAAQAIDQRFGWASVRPPLFGALTLAGLRTTLRRRNLYDSDRLPAVADQAPAPEPPRPLARSADGRGNDPHLAAMGAANTRFGRNVPLEATVPDAERMMTPNPRVVSRALMTRHEFVPATTLNLLAACWLQALDP